MASSLHQQTQLWWRLAQERGSDDTASHLADAALSSTVEASGGGVDRRRVAVVLHRSPSPDPVADGLLERQALHPASLPWDDSRVGGWRRLCYRGVERMRGQQSS